MSDILPTATPYVFEVKSSVSQIRYKVDISARGGYGSCQCPDFSRRKLPAIAKGKPMGTSATACKHLLAARTEYLNRSLRQSAQSLGR